MNQQETALVAPQGVDWEMFQRVWQRVMPQERPGQPVELVPPPAAQSPALAPAPPPEAIYDPREALDRWPAQETCLGANSQGYGGDLQHFLEQELTAAKTYSLLSRRVTGQSARALAALSAQNRQQAKRLSTAYFLLSGVRYWPDDPSPYKGKVAVLPALRQQFAREQRRGMDYRTAEVATHDPYLKELYLSLAETADAHTWLLLDILEGL